LRAEALHQCNASSPLLTPTSRGKAIATGAYFKGTALAVLDASLEVLAWTWMLPRPEDQVSIAHNGSRWFVPPGVHDGFATPPWGKPAYDTRLLLLDEEIVAGVAASRASDLGTRDIPADVAAGARIPRHRVVDAVVAWANTRRGASGSPCRRGRVVDAEDAKLGRGDRARSARL
jgi:hypothetical protein